MRAIYIVGALRAARCTAGHILMTIALLMTPGTYTDALNEYHLGFRGCVVRKRDLSQKWYTLDVRFSVASEFRS